MTSDPKRHRARRPQARRFYALVRERRRKLEAKPIPRRITYPEVNAHEVIGI